MSIAFSCTSYSQRSAIERAVSCSSYPCQPLLFMSTKMHQSQHEGPHYCSIMVTNTKCCSYSKYRHKCSTVPADALNGGFMPPSRWCIEPQFFGESPVASCKEGGTSRGIGPSIGDQSTHNSDRISLVGVESSGILPGKHLDYCKYSPSNPCQMKVFASLCTLFSFLANRAFA